MRGYVGARYVLALYAILVPPYPRTPVPTRNIVPSYLRAPAPTRRISGEPTSEDACKEYLQAVVERDAGGDHEEGDALGNGEGAAAAELQSGYVEREQEHHHREDEVVGHNGREHDVGKGEEQGGEQGGVGASQADDFAAYAIDEDDAVEAAEEQYGGHDEEGAVDAGDGHEGLVEQVGDEHEEGQQGVAVDVVLGRPVGDHIVGDGVEARDVEPADEHRPGVVGDGGEGMVVVANDERVERREHQQGRQGQRALFSLDEEQT